MMDDRVATRCRPDVELHAQAMACGCFKHRLRILRHIEACPQAAMRVEIIRQDEAFRHLVCDFENAVDLDCHAQWQFRAGHSGPGMSACIAEHIDHQV